MIKLLKYYTKKRAYIVGILSVMLILLAILTFKDGYVYLSHDGSQRPTNNPITLYLVCACFLATIIPMFEFNFKMRKVGIDEYYSFPIKREKLYSTKFIVGLLEVLIPMTILFLYTLVDIVLSIHVFDLWQYVLFYLLSIPTIAAVYAINSFIFAKCNTTYDGIINVFLVQFVFVILSYIILETLEITTKGDPSFFFVYSPMSRLSAYFRDLMNQYELTRYDLSLVTISIVSGILFFLLGIASFVLLIMFQKHEKSENSMDISDSWFSYKTMLPIYIVGAQMVVTNESLSFIILVILMGYIGYAIYRRNFKLKFTDVTIIASSIVIGVFLGAIS